MKTAMSEKNVQETPGTLQINRNLLPIDKYAAREGVSKDIVEECGKVGLVQIRKHKGKTFVVDVRKTIFDEVAETDEDIGSVELPDMEIFGLDEELTGLMDEITEDEERQAEKTEESNEFEFDVLIAQAKSIRSWQIATVLSLGFFIAALFGNLWLYSNLKIQRSRLNQAYVNMHRAQTDSTKATKQLEEFKVSQETIENNIAGK